MQNTSRFFYLAFALLCFGELSAQDYTAITEFSRQDFFNEDNEPIVPGNYSAAFNVAYVFDKNALYNAIHKATKDKKTISAEDLYTLTCSVATQSAKSYIRPAALTALLFAADFAYLFGMDFIPYIGPANNHAVASSNHAARGALDYLSMAANVQLVGRIWQPTPQLWRTGNDY